MISELWEEVLKGEIEVAEVSKRPLITEMSESISEYRNNCLNQELQCYGFST